MSLKPARLTAPVKSGMSLSMTVVEIQPRGAQVDDADARGRNEALLPVDRGGWPYLLVPLIPVAMVLEFVHADAGVGVPASALGVIPTAALMGRATEELAARSGPGIGGFLNVTFGNAPELIIALFALGAGLHEVVKASLVGSILGNILLVLGVSMLAGGLRRDRQDFEPRAASAQALLLLLATVALIMPAIFELVQGAGPAEPARPGGRVPGERAVAVGRGGGGAAGVLRGRRCCSRSRPTRTCSTPRTTRTTTAASRGRCAAA